MDNKYALFIETLGTDINLMILDSNNKVIKTLLMPTKQDMIEHIIQELDAILKESKINHHNIKKIFWVSQPGLYTGMRIGSLMCKAFSTLHDVEIYEISRLQLQAQGKCLSLCDAKGEKYYLQVFDNESAITDVLLISKDAIKEYESNYPDFKVIIDAAIDQKLVLSHLHLFKKIDMNEYHLPYYKDAC